MGLTEVPNVNPGRAVHGEGLRRFVSLDENGLIPVVCGCVERVWGGDCVDSRAENLLKEGAKQIVACVLTERQGKFEGPMIATMIRGGREVKDFTNPWEKDLQREGS